MLLCLSEECEAELNKSGFLTGSAVPVPKTHTINLAMSHYKRLEDVKKLALCNSSRSRKRAQLAQSLPASPRSLPESPTHSLHIQSQMSIRRFTEYKAILFSNFSKNSFDFETKI